MKKKKSKMIPNGISELRKMTTKKPKKPAKATKKMYVIMGLRTSYELTTTNLGLMFPATVNFNHENGMVGVLEVFSNRKDAEKRADGKYSIVEIEQIKP